MRGLRQQSNADGPVDAGPDPLLDVGRDWPRLALRATPFALLLILIPVAVAFWPASDGSETDGGFQVETDERAESAPQNPGLAARVIDGPGSDREQAGPPLALGGDGERPQLLIQGTLADGGPDPAGVTTSTGPSSSTTSTAGAESNGSSSTQTTSGRTTTDRSGRSSTTGPTTVSPTTRGQTTAAPTTRPPTTATPTTRPPTTAAPTTRPPTTRPPTTAAPTTVGGNCASNSEFERIFRDDFNGSSVGGAWFQYNSVGNNNYGLRRPSANSVGNGALTITAKMENGSLVSGGMSHNVDQTYGKWVVKVRTDNDPSQAVSGVVLTWPQSGVHPRDGENNIYETLVKTPNRNPFFTFIHKPFGSKSDQEHYKHTADGSQYQVMTMEWTPSRITIIREGPGGSSYRDVWTVNETSANLIPDVPHHLAIQLDAWKHSIGGPVKLQVDFVEVYKYCG